MLGFLVAAVVIVMAAVGGILFLNSQRTTTQPTVQTRITVEPPAPADTTADRPTTEPSSVTASPLAPGQASNFVNQLYDDWTERNTAVIHGNVDREYWSSFDPDFLDRIDVYRVTSFNTSESISGTNARVCGSQMFYRDDGMTQEESRCFLVASTGYGLKVVWTGDQKTVKPWFVT